MDVSTFVAIASTALLAASGWAVSWFMGERKVFMGQLRCLEDGMTEQGKTIMALMIHKDTHAEKLDEIRGSINDTCSKLDGIIAKQGEMLVAIQKVSTQRGDAR
jgi:hypothetical protein